jgi:spore coat polysaccharide biosynthesis protein SpsF
MARAVVILQARMGSRRLPGKTLMDLSGRTLLEHCVRRLEGAGLPLVVATTRRPEDDAIVREAGRLGASVFRGETDDVLARYVAAAQAVDATLVVRATADNPLVDGRGVGRALALLDNVGADHVVEFGLPIGAAVEAVRVEALERAWTLIADPYDREHVTSFIRRDGRFQSLRAMAPRALRRPGLRLTVDTQTDYDFVRDVLSSCDADFPVLEEIIRVADARLVQMAAAERRERGA